MQKGFNCKEFAWDKVLSRGLNRIRRGYKVWSSVKSLRQYEEGREYDAEVQDSGTLAAAGPVAREVVIAPKCALSPRRSHSSMACVIQHRRTLALRHHLLIKRKKDIVAASYNAVDALNFFVGHRSSKINQSASGIRFERSLSRRASYVLSRTTRPPSLPSLVL
jgi:hypothetical protein